MVARAGGSGRSESDPPGSLLSSEADDRLEVQQTANTHGRTTYTPQVVSDVRKHVQRCDHRSVRDRMMLEDVEGRGNAMHSGDVACDEQRWRIKWAEGAGHEEGGDGDVEYDTTGRGDGWEVRFYIRRSKWLQNCGVKWCARGLYAARRYKKGELLTYYGGVCLGPRHAKETEDGMTGRKKGAGTKNGNNVGGKVLGSTRCA